MDDTAFEAQALALERTLFRVAFGILGRSQDCLDAAQSALMKAWTKRRAIAPEAFRPWLIRIVINESRTILRKRRRETPVPKTGEANEIALDLDIEVPGVHFSRIVLSHTPIELSMELTGEGDYANWRANPFSLRMIGDDGTPLMFTENGATVNENGKATFTGAWATGAEMPPRVTLFVRGTNMALVIDTKTGEAALHPADRMADGKVIVRYDEPLTYVETQ